MYEAEVHVTLKKSVLDPQGETVRSALETLGFQGITDCRIGKFMVLKLAETDAARARSQVEEMCKKLLANPTIEEYVFQLREVSG